MATRKLVHEEVFSASVADVFSLLHTPSSIRQWWGVSRAIVLPEPGGIWAAVWGDVEDDPDYVTIATIREFEPPRRMILCNYRYRARTGPQDGFPETPEASEFHAAPVPGGFRHGVRGRTAFRRRDSPGDACQQGWQNTFASIRRFFAEGEGSGTRE